MTIIASAFWRRLDLPGHEASRLQRTDAGWRLEGMAVFRHEAGPASLAYAVDCAADWQAMAGQVHGMLGERRIDYAVVRRDGVWALNGAVVPGLDHLVDLDIGFTPATNLLPLRRVPIADGETAELPAAWLDIDAGTLTELAQTYQRRGAHAYWYEAPRFGYQALLEFAPDGFVRRYPNLWEAEPSP